MFDSFWVKHQEKQLEVQSKKFARVLGNYHPGDFVLFDFGKPADIEVFVEPCYWKLENAYSPQYWCVLILFKGCFVDYLICSSEDEASAAAKVMDKLWQQPERQLESMLRIAEQHHEALESNKVIMNGVLALLHYYQRWVENKGQKPEHVISLHWHDFEKEAWDVALAKLICGREAYRCLLPKKYLGENNETIEEARHANSR